MKALRGPLALALLVALLGLLAPLSSAARCRMGGCCAWMAKVSSTAPCQRSAGGFAAPTDCCRRLPASAPTTVGSATACSEPAPGSAPAPVPVVHGPAVALAGPGYSRAGGLHSLGLFTLHSVWRI